MSSEFPDCFLLVPTSIGAEEATMFTLTESDSFAPNSFVLLPYQNPQIKSPMHRFFKIKAQYKIDLSATKLNTLNPPAIHLQTKTNKKKYIQKVEELKKHIQLGNIYEINFCIEFFADSVQIDPWSIFIALIKLSKAPYSALLKINDDYIVSASPELFLKKEGNRLYSKPIKGTIRRGNTSEEDAYLKEQLHSSLKERTENVMAVDVARNDLSQIAARGSVHVNKLYNIESFETVHQMVSTVSCELKANTSFNDILNATFPMASMTGAPKLRAMTLIDEFEDFERTNYSGAMGIIDEKGDFTLSVIIRSIFYNSNTKRLSLSVGGAITYLCEPEKEYEECLLKAKALLNVLNAEIS